MLFTNTLSMLLVAFNPLLNTLKIIFMIFFLHLIWILFFPNLTDETEVENIVVS